VKHIDEAIAMEENVKRLLDGMIQTSRLVTVWASSAVPTGPGRSPRAPRGSRAQWRSRGVRIRRVMQCG
jgi:hypothetical protein